MSINERITPPSWMKNPHPTVYGWVDKFTGEVLMRIRDIPNPDLTYTQMNAKGPYPKVAPVVSTFEIIDPFGAFTKSVAPNPDYYRYTASEEGFDPLYGFISQWTGSFDTETEYVTFDFIMPDIIQNPTIQYTFIFSQSDFATTFNNMSDAVIFSVHDVTNTYSTTVYVRDYGNGPTTINSTPLAGLTPGTRVRLTFNIDQISIYNINTEQPADNITFPNLFSMNGSFNVFMWVLSNTDGENISIDVTDPIADLFDQA